MEISEENNVEFIVFLKQTEQYTLTISTSTNIKSTKMLQYILNLIIFM